MLFVLISEGAFKFLLLYDVVASSIGVTISSMVEEPGIKFALPSPGIPLNW